MLLAFIKHIIPRHHKACLPLLCRTVMCINTFMFGDSESGKKRPYYVLTGGRGGVTIIPLCIFSLSTMNNQKVNFGFIMILIMYIHCPAFMLYPFFTPSCVK